MNDFADTGKTNPIKPNFKGKKMLLHLTINGQRESFGYYADEIEAAVLLLNGFAPVLLLTGRASSIQYRPSNKRDEELKNS